MQFTQVHLIRHGQVEGYEQKRYNGQAEVPLTEEGLRQYGELRQFFLSRPIKAIYSSDLSRCSFGAEIIGKPHGISPVLLPDLKELDAGQWEGTPWAEIEKEDPDLWKRRLDDIVNIPAPGGESLRQMAERVRKAMKEITCLHRGEEVLIVGHGGVNRVILLDALGAPLTQVLSLEQSFGCYNKLTYRSDGRTVVQCMNLKAPYDREYRL